MSRFIRTAGLICITLAACQGGSDISGIGGLAFEATAVIVPPPAQNVVVTVKLTNISSNTIQLEYGPCSVRPVFHSGSPEGPIALDTGTLDCAGAGHSASLDPDQSVQVTSAWVPSLPAGKYYVVAAITLSGETATVNAGTVTF